MISRYSRDAMTAIWSDQSRYEAWLEVELAACEAMEAEGTVPTGTAGAVREKALIDAARIDEIEKRTRHDVIAFLTAVEESAGEPARWLHLGMTSSDVLDSAFALQLKKAVARLEEGLAGFTEALAARAREHARTPVIGRSHGIHGEPTTVGLVFGSFYAEAKRNQDRLRRAAEGIAVGKIAGAMGNYGNVSPDVEARALAKLGLRPETVATQVVARDRHAELFGTLAVIGAGIERFAVTVRHWQRTEVGEAEEKFTKGQKGSSAMPHKRNPILSENLTGLARLLRAWAGAAYENVALWHERDISHSSVERVIAPDATVLLDFALARATRLAEGLVVKPERMRENLDRLGGLTFSERVLLLLIQAGLGRQEAYERVQKSALAALDGRGSFRELLGADEVVKAKLGEEGLASAFDEAEHLQHTDAILARAGLVPD